MIDDFIHENKRITDAINVVLHNLDCNAACAVVSMLTLCIQKHMRNGGNLEQMLDAIKHLWGFVEEMNKYISLKEKEIATQKGDGDIHE